MIQSLFDFHEEVSLLNENRSLEGHNDKLTKLVLELRHSLELPFKDNEETFHFRLVGGHRLEGKSDCQLELVNRVEAQGVLKGRRKSE